MSEKISLPDKRFLVLCGNYGSGKTELALNLVLQAVSRGSATLVDLDIVNPYFRSGEKAELLSERGVRVLMPTFAMTAVDVPALPAEMQSVFELPCDHVIFDVGGDDTGAAALGRYAPSFARFRSETTSALVVNTMRPLTRKAEDIADLARRIEQRSRLKLDVLINNTNLADETTQDMLREGHQQVAQAAKMLGIARVMTAGTKEILDACPELPGQMVISRYMEPEWMVEQ